MRKFSRRDDDGGDSGSLEITHLTPIATMSSFEEILEWVIITRDPVSTDALIHIYRQFVAPEQLLELLEKIYEKGVSKGDHQTETSCCVFLMRWVNSNLSWDFCKSSSLLGKAMAFASTALKPEDRTRLQLMFLKSKPKACLDQGLWSMSSNSSPTPSLQFMEWSAKTVAIHLTMLEAQLYQGIQPFEFENLAWQQDDKDTLAPSLALQARRFNDLSKWITATILYGPPDYKAPTMVSRWIKLASELEKLHNYQTLMSVLAGLNHGAVQRLKQCWDDVSPKYTEQFRELEDLMSPLTGFKNYTTDVSGLADDVPVVPYMGAYLGRIAMMQVSNKMAVEDKINYPTFNVVGKTVAECLHFRDHAPYTYKMDDPVMLFFLNVKLSVTEDDLYAQSMSLEASRSGASNNLSPVNADKKKKRRFSFASLKAPMTKSNKTLLKKAMDVSSRASNFEGVDSTDALVSPREFSSSSRAEQPVDKAERRRQLLLSQKALNRSFEANSYSLQAPLSARLQSRPTRTRQSATWPQRGPKRLRPSLPQFSGAYTTRSSVVASPRKLGIFDESTESTSSIASDVQSYDAFSTSELMVNVADLLKTSKLADDTEESSFDSADLKATKTSTSANSSRNGSRRKRPKAKKKRGLSRRQSTTSLLMSSEPDVPEHEERTLPARVVRKQSEEENSGVKGEEVDDQGTEHDADVSSESLTVDTSSNTKKKNSPRRRKTRKPSEKRKASGGLKPRKPSSEHRSPPNPTVPKVTVSGLGDADGTDDGPAVAKKRPASARRTKKKKSPRPVSSIPSSPALQGRKPSDSLSPLMLRKTAPSKVKRTPRATKHKNPREWNNTDVCQWLVRSGLQFLAPAFKENEIEGADLFDLTLDDLREMGVKTNVHEKFFKRSMAELVSSMDSAASLEDADSLSFVLQSANSQRVLKVPKGTNFASFQRMHQYNGRLMFEDRDGPLLLDDESFAYVCAHATDDKVIINVT